MKYRIKCYDSSCKYKHKCKLYAFDEAQINDSINMEDDGACEMYVPKDDIKSVSREDFPEDESGKHLLESGIDNLDLMLELTK